MEICSVNLDKNSYTMYVGSQILSKIGSLLKENDMGEKALLITCFPIQRLYGEYVESIIRDAGFDLRVIELPDGEGTKDLKVVARLYDEAIEFGCDRNSPVIALGGGVIGDVAGFFAATYLRGIPFVQIPTTLLAQVDSSVGGKVGVNHFKGKNMIGAFYQPKFVLSDIEVLKSLPEREFRSGLAEVIKYGVIWDEELFSILESNINGLSRGELGDSPRIVARCCRIKAAVVEQDERETNLRAILNYGHTVGHSVERASKFARYRHGEAVSIGMVSAALLSERMGLSKGITKRIVNLLHGVGLPLIWDDLEVEEIITGFKYDKKFRDGRIRFILPEAIGKVRMRDDVSESLLKETLETQKNLFAKGGWGW